MEKEKMKYHPFVEKFKKFNIELINTEGFMNWDRVHKFCEEYLDPINFKVNKVVIDEAASAGAEEMYAEWFICPNCKDDMITKFSKYCPGCGCRIIWK